MTDFMDTSLSPVQRAKLLLPKLSLKEKVGQLNQRLYGFHAYTRNGETLAPSGEFVEEVRRFGGLGTLYGLYRADPWSQKEFHNGLVGPLAAKAYNLLQKIVLEHSRFKIPMLLSSECPHGHQALEGYLLPVNLAAGATFHPQLLKEAGAVCGSQLKEMGVNLALVSMLDILRDPRWGRSEECFGEDPFLAAEFSKAVIEGIQNQGVGVIAKHFCAQGETTGGVNASAARIGERELREIHLPAAEACCKQGVAGFMAAYNEIDGVFCHANKHLLTDILRGEYGFDGVVMADGCAIDNLLATTGDLEHAAAAALSAGVDIGLWDKAFGRLENAVQSGLVKEQDIDQAVLRVLTLKFAQGLFEHPFIPENASGTAYSYTRYPQSLQIARESAVLLKNEDHLLPFTVPAEGAGLKVAVIGPGADDLYRQLGDYTPPMDASECVTVLKGLQTLAPSGVKILYAKGAIPSREAEHEGFAGEAALASQCDVAVLVLGGSSNRFNGAQFDINGAAIQGETAAFMDCGEGMDLATLELPAEQTTLFYAVRETGIPIVTVIIAGRPYAIPEIAQQSDSLLYCFYPGPQGGTAIAEILYGIIGPSGRLPASLPCSAAQLPVYYNPKNSYRSMKYYDLPDAPLYRFGAGVGYGELHYQDAMLSADKISIQELLKNPLTVHFSVSNKGKRKDAAVPQLYVQLLQGSTVRRVRELKAFSKLPVSPGETVAGNLVLPAESFSVWNAQMKHVVEPGKARLLLMDSDRLIWNAEVTLTGRECTL